MILLETSMTMFKNDGSAILALFGIFAVAKLEDSFGRFWNLLEFYLVQISFLRPQIPIQPYILARAHCYGDMMS